MTSPNSDLPRYKWTDPFAAAGGILVQIIGVLIFIFGIFAAFYFLQAVFADEEMSDREYYVRLIIGVIGGASLFLGFYVRWLSIHVIRIMGSPRLRLDRVEDLIGRQPTGVYASTGRALLDLGSRPRKALLLLNSIAKDNPGFASTAYLSAVACTLLFEQEAGKDEHLHRAASFAEEYVQRRPNRPEALACLARLTGEQAVLAARRRDESSARQKETAANDLFSRAATTSPTLESDLDPYVPAIATDALKSAQDEFERRLREAREAAQPKPSELWTFTDASGALLAESLDVATVRARLLNGSLPTTALCRRDDKQANEPLMKSIAQREFEIDVLFHPISAHMRNGARIGLGLAIALDVLALFILIMNVIFGQSEGSGFLIILGIMIALPPLALLLGGFIGLCVGVLRAPRLRADGAYIPRTRMA